MLEERLAELTAQYSGQEPQRPPFWGGYRLAPQAIEFWQGGVHRLHDRLLYTQVAQGLWKRAPCTVRCVL